MAESSTPVAAEATPPPTVGGPEELGKWARIMISSGLFDDVTAASQALVKIQAGREIGVPPVQAMTAFDIIEGQLSASADLVATRVKQSERYDYRVTEMSAERCEIRFLEDGEEIGVSTFTMEDAKLAEVRFKTKNGYATNWVKYPRNMLFARAMTNGVRWFCPDVTASTVYTAEELGHLTALPPEKANGKAEDGPSPAPEPTTAGPVPDEETEPNTTEPVPDEETEVDRLAAIYHSVVTGEGVEPPFLDENVTWGKLAGEGHAFTYRDAIETDNPDPDLPPKVIRKWMHGVEAAVKKDLGEEANRVSAWSPTALKARITLAWNDQLQRQYEEDLKAGDVKAWGEKPGVTMEPGGIPKEINPAGVEVRDAIDEIPGSDDPTEFEKLFRSLKSDKDRRMFLASEFGAVHPKGKNATKEELTALAIEKHAAQEKVKEGA